MNYQNHYDILIERSRDRLLEGYSERHHIVPRCMGGSDDAENIAVLTAEEHYVAHQLLVRMNPGNHKLVTAVIRMSGHGKNRNNKAFGWIRRKNAIAISEINTGVAKTAQHKHNLSIAKTGVAIGPMSNEAKQKKSVALTGKPSQLKGKTYIEIYGKEAATLQGMKRNVAKTGVTRPLVICPICKEIGGAGAMHRWHFDNCKELAHA